MKLSLVAADFIKAGAGPSIVAAMPKKPSRRLVRIESAEDDVVDSAMCGYEIDPLSRRGYCFQLAFMVGLPDRPTVTTSILLPAGVHGRSARQSHCHGLATASSWPSWSVCQIVSLSHSGYRFHLPFLVCLPDRPTVTAWLLLTASVYGWSAAYPCRRTRHLLVAESRFVCQTVRRSAGFCFWFRIIRILTSTLIITNKIAMHFRQRLPS